MSNYVNRLSDREIKKIELHATEIIKFSEHPFPWKFLDERVGIFSKRLDLAMKAQEGMTQNRLASEAGISSQTILDIRKGRNSQVNPYHLYLFAAILNCTPHYLLGLVEQPNEYMKKIENQNGERERLIPPIIPQRLAQKKFIELIKRFSHKDPVFVDYIYQIAQDSTPDGAEIARAVVLLYYGRFMDLNEPIDIDIFPASWTQRNIMETAGD